MKKNNLLNKAYDVPLFQVKGTYKHPTESNSYVLQLKRSKKKLSVPFVAGHIIHYMTNDLKKLEICHVATNKFIWSLK